MAEHYASFLKQNGYKHPDHEESDKVEFPQGMELIWEYFHSLSNSRGSNGFGSNPISYPDIAAWNELTESNVTALEVKIIKRLDITYLNHQAKEQAKKNKDK